MSMMMNIPSIKERVLTVISDVLALDNIPNLDAHIEHDLNADSIDVVTLMVCLEEEFEGSIDENQIDRLQTVGDIIDYITMKFVTNHSHA